MNAPETLPAAVLLPPSSLLPSPTNPRKHFDPAKLAELAESIKEHGVIQPILVRKWQVGMTLPPGKTFGDMADMDAHEIACGERRWRASQIAGLAEIPAMVRPMTDTEALEAQVIENLQREDVTELEEAEGYEVLMRTGNLNADQVGAKIGKSRSYVFARLKLLDLSHECQTALRAGDIDASRALLIARIPDTALQAKALFEATRKDGFGSVCSLRVFQTWLQNNVMLRLEKASFSITDASLLDKVGSCKECPKRTGANPDLFIDVPSADICIDPACYHAKAEAHRASVLAIAQKRGMAVITGDEADDICSQYNDSLAGYSRLTQVRLDAADGSEATLGQLLGADLPAPVLIENPHTKELIAAVPTIEAEAMLLARGLIKALDTKAKAPKVDLEADIARLQKRLDQEIDKAYRAASFTALADAVHSCPADMSARLITGGLLREFFLQQIDEIYNPDMAAIFGIEITPKGTSYSRAIEDKQETELRLHIQACPTAKLFQALALFLVQNDKAATFCIPAEDPEPTHLFAQLAQEIPLDLDAIRQDVAFEVREEAGAELAKLKAELKASQPKPPGAEIKYRGPNGETWTGRGLKPRWVTAHLENGGTLEQLTQAPLPLAPAAQASGVGGPKAKKTKTPAAQAQAQIAAALQAQEETNPGADAQGNEVRAVSQPVATSTPPDAIALGGAGVALAVDMRVVVTSEHERLPITQHKWASKEGVITQAMDDNRWMVTFSGRTSGMCAFDTADLAGVLA